MSTIINGTSSAITFPDSTVQNSAGLTGSSSQLCKAWAQFSATGGTVVINTSYNISLITRNGTGDFTVSFTTAMPSLNYSVAAGNGIDTSGSICVGIPDYAVSTNTVTAPTTSAFRYSLARTASGAGFDGAYNQFAVFSS